jgi:DNA helicase-2/ATP-dependent DNA helicase PcrA
MHILRGMIDYEAELNPSQLEAVNTLDGPVLVIAGAGSGKTRTLVYRVARLVENGVRPEHILLLTFTRKSSDEMLSRAATLIDERCRRVAGGTFHSFACLMLRRYGDFLGIPPDFTILDRPDSESYINTFRKEFQLDGKKLAFPKKDTLMDIFSKAVNKDSTISLILENEYPHHEIYRDEILAISKAYIAGKQKKNLLDFDDLLLKFHDLLGKEEIRDKVANFFRYIMIDEYQDTNKIQARIGLQLASHWGNIMVVGDDAQSIYSFRGAYFKNIINFPKEFQDKIKIIKLEENYRSTQPILDFTNSVIQSAREKFTKKLFTSRVGGRKPALALTNGEHLQSQFVGQRIDELRKEGIKLHEIAVLFRYAFHSADLEMELKKRRIHYVKYGGFKFFESAHLKDMLAFLRVVVNSHDNPSWLRILSLIEGVGAKTAGDILSQIDKVEDPLDFESYDLGKKKVKEELIKLGRLLRQFQNISADLKKLMADLLTFYTPYVQKQFDDYPRRLRDLEQIKSIANRYTSVSQFLHEITLEPPDKSLDGNMTTEAAQNDTLILSTIHSAKGLEWRVVFILWASQGKFPTQWGMNSPDDFEEERRLFYVASTRAKDELNICAPINVFDPISGERLSKATPFMEPVPVNLYEIWRVRY